MAWPNDDLNTSHLDADSDSPALARPMLERAIIRLKAVIAARGVRNGIASLDGAGKVPAAQLPDSVLAGTLLWSPTGAYQQMTRGTTALLALTTSVAPFRRLRIDQDIQLNGSSGGGSDDGSPAFAAVPYAGFGQDVYVYPAFLPAAGFADISVRGGAIGLQRTSNTSITVRATLLSPRNPTGATSGFRLYGIYGYTT